MKYYIRQIILIIMLIATAVGTYSKEPFVVVIDAGHGGHDTGAVDNGVKEKDINLGVALKLEDILKKKMKKDVKVVMTRDDDNFISLQRRADIANHSKGNLFISIHTNSVDKTNKNRKSVQGTSVYALGLHRDKDNMKVAQRENSVIELEKDYKQKYSGFDPSKDESYIIFEMAQKKTLEQSLKFAGEAQKHLVSDAERSNRGVKQAGFWVLWATSMPAVLVELDFICNPKSAKFMGSKDGQQKLAEALYHAVDSYLKTNPSRDMANAVDSKGTRVLKVVEEEKKTDVAPAKRRSGQSLSSRRKRRSLSARKTSEVVANAEIPLGSGADSGEEITEGEISVSEETMNDSDQKNSDRKKKKDKKSKKKDKKETKKKSKNYNSRRIIVDNKGNVVGMQELDENGNVKAASNKKTHKTKKEKIKTVYKIQILASEERLKKNDVRFCGLKRISSFKENDMYKYTYGETTDREEIERMLEEVKEKIPDAFIIKSTK